jgi:SagB-type dehydrogenase family enzyme
LGAASIPLIAGVNGSGVSDRYTQRVFRRFREPMQPEGFAPDWDDQPSRHKFYEGAPLLPLPIPFQTAQASLGESLQRLADAGSGQTSALTWEVLSTILGAYCVNGRRTQLMWGDDSPARLAASHAVWGRATASGGGMYPAEAYIVMGGGTPVLPGVYHHDTAYHGLARLSVGDVTGHIRDAIRDERMRLANCYLIATARFWKSTFKYNNFAYHLITQDVGALLGSWRILLSAAGVASSTTLWFNEQHVDEILDLDTTDESSFAVLSFRWPTADAPSGREAEAAASWPTLSRVVRARLAPWERSRSIRRFSEVETIHAAALVGPAPRPPSPDPPRSLPHASPAKASSSGLLMEADLRQCFRERRSSFGLFTSSPPIEREVLGTVLWACAMAGQAPSDVTMPRTRLWVLANAVAGVKPGTYRYDGSTEQLVRLQELDIGALLQKLYALDNYNMTQVAAVLVISGFLDEARRRYGDRGYRMLNLEVGAVAQTAYFAAAATGIGCGAVGGIDNVAVDELLGIASSGENSLLFVLLGHERPGAARVRHEVPC